MYIKLVWFILVVGFSDLNVVCHFKKSTQSPILTPWGRVLFEKIIVTQLANKFSTFYETQRFITLFTRAHHWSLSSAR